MTSATRRSVYACCLAITAGTGPAWALDLGDPLYRTNAEGEFRLEVIYESYDRDVEARLSEQTFVTGEDEVFVAARNAIEAIEGDAALLRASFLGGDQATLYLDAGVLDSDMADSSPTVLGGGLRVRTYESSTASISAVLAGHYIPTYDVTIEGEDADIGRKRVDGEVDVYEVGAGLLFAAMSDLTPSVQIIPYLGVMASLLRGDFEVQANYLDEGVASTESVDIEEDHLVGVVLGSSLLFNDRFSARLEARLLTETSFSGSLGFPF